MFTLHAIALALITILALLAAICAFIAVQWPRDRIAALLFVRSLGQLCDVVERSRMASQ